MPLLAAFIGNLAVGLVAIFSKFMALDLALKFASYLAWMTVFAIFVGSVTACVFALSNTIQAGFAWAQGWSLGSATSAIVSGFGTGLGMFIPANATAVITCVSSVWIACQIYKIQKTGIHNYSK